MWWCVLGVRVRSVLPKPSTPNHGAYLHCLFARGWEGALCVVVCVGCAVFVCVLVWGGGRG